MLTGFKRWEPVKAFSTALQKGCSKNLLCKPGFTDCESAPSRKAELGWLHCLGRSLISSLLLVVLPLGDRHFLLMRED